MRIQVHHVTAVAWATQKCHRGRRIEALGKSHMSLQWHGGLTYDYPRRNQNDLATTRSDRHGGGCFHVGSSAFSALLIDVEFICHSLSSTVAGGCHVGCSSAVPFFLICFDFISTPSPALAVGPLPSTVSWLCLFIRGSLDIGASTLGRVPILVSHAC